MTGLRQTGAPAYVLEYEFDDEADAIKFRDAFAKLVETVVKVAPRDFDLVQVGKTIEKIRKGCVVPRWKQR